ncbi:hypothetical protein [Sphingobium chungangianum]
MSLAQRSMLLAAISVWTAMLLGYMHLRHEVEQIGPRDALVTDHFTGEVRQCDTHGYGDWSCWPADIEPRSWVFAVTPFWPVRRDLGEKLNLSETWADDTPFTETPLYSALINNGIIGFVMLVVGIFVMWPRAENGTSSSGGEGGSDGGGLAGE